MRNWLLAAALLLTYNSWLLWPLNGNPDAMQGYLSELAAQDQPFSWLFRLLDGVAGSIMLLIGLLGYRGWHSLMGGWARIAAGGLVAAGLATMIDAVFAMPCSSTFNAVCAANEATDPGQTAHAAASAVVGAAQTVALLAASIGLARRKGWLPWAASCSLATVLIVVLMWVTVWWDGAVGRGQGSFQSAQILLLTAVVGLLTLQLSTRER